MWAERSEPRELGDLILFVDVVAPAPRLVDPRARSTTRRRSAASRAPPGWRPFVCDPRSQFATPERFPDAEEVIAAWPDEAFARLGGSTAPPTSRSSPTTPSSTTPRSSSRCAPRRAYVGAMGSRRAQAQAPRAPAAQAGMSERAARPDRRSDRPRPRRRDARRRRRSRSWPRSSRSATARRAGGSPRAAGASTRWARDRWDRPRRRPGVALREREAARPARRPPAARARAARHHAVAGRARDRRAGRRRRGGHRGSRPAWRRAARLRPLAGGPGCLARLRPRRDARLRGRRRDPRRPAARVPGRDRARDRRARRRRSCRAGHLRR